MSPLAQIIRQEIERRGPISFAHFMERALYHPELGYYERGEPRTGQTGDYFTSVSVGSLFGELLGFRCARWLSSLPNSPLQLVEAGAHDGRLAADMLTFLRAHEPELSERIQYWLLEPSAKRRAWQREVLGGFGGCVRWAEDWTALPGVRGVILSNELLDAMPIHRLVWSQSEQGWHEAGVACAGERFVWTALRTLPAGSAPVVPSELQAALPDGYVVEVGTAALEWWRQAAVALERGWLVTCDYGDAPGERFQAGRYRGTLRAYRNHQVNTELLADPGEQDLTGHVDFGAVQVAGEAGGLRTEGFWRQEAFLGNILREIDSGAHAFPAWTAARVRQCQTLVHPNHLGTRFKVLVQTKGMD